MNTENIFGERVKTLRKELNMTQTELSKVSGIPQPQISKYEKNQEIPYQKNAVLLARGLRTTVDYLFGKTEDPSPNEIGDIEKAKEYLNPEKPVVPVFNKDHFVKFRYKGNGTTPDSPIKSMKLTEEIFKETEEKKESYDDSLIEVINNSEKNPILQYIINDYDADYAVIMPDKGMEPLIPKGAICFIRDTNVKFTELPADATNPVTMIAAAIGLVSLSILTAIRPSSSFGPALAGALSMATAAISSGNLPKQFNIFLPPIFEHDHMWVRKYDKENNIVTPINHLDYPNDTFKFSNTLKLAFGTIGIVRGYKMNLDLRDYRKKESK